MTDALADGARAVPTVWTRCWAALLLLAATGAANAAIGVGGAGGTVLPGVALLSALVAWGAANRVTVLGADADGLGPAGLQFGRLELRLVAALLLNLLFLTMIAAVLALVALALFGAAGLDAGAVRSRDWAAVGPTWKLAVLAVVGGIVLAVPVALMVRLALFSQATVGRGHAVSLNTMGIARGSFWRLLVLLAALLTPLVGLSAAAAHGTVLAVGAAIAVAALWLPFAAGALGSAYRSLEHWKPGG
ncbi:MAG TPA: hypothetical protein VGR32_10810 [Brevundimonas sp.]|uniref:hypothetical protein n=1 Tax=Brevundimonas sp. TaxID=1871086 RepID=UPI002DEF2D1A|nr:hypothetical protein [Brevundimonas sp.]